MFNPEELRGSLITKGYELGDLIGKGSFGRCYHVIRTSGRYSFACKVIPFSDQERRDKLLQSSLNEMEMLKTIDHINILSIFDCFVVENMCVIILEYCPNGSLADLINQNPDYFADDPQKLFSYASQLINAVTFLHDNGIAHHDIKPSNCLLDKNRRIKLSDFGLSKHYSNLQKSCEHCGTPAFLAPEMGQKDGYDPFKSDIWALGVTLFNLYSGVLPFSGIYNTKKLKSIQATFYLNVPHKIDIYTKSIAKIINACLTFNPEDRATARDLKLMVNQCSTPIKQEAKSLSKQNFYYASIIAPRASPNNRRLRVPLSQSHVANRHRHSGFLECIPPSPIV